MRQPFVVLLALSLIVALVGLAPSRPLAAATPMITTPDAAPLALVESLGSGLPAAAPNYHLLLRRVTWGPSFTLAMHRHPGSAGVIAVEMGTLHWAQQRGHVEITRAALMGTPGPSETLGPGGETVLRPGDWLFTDEGAEDEIHTAAVVGDEPVVLLVAILAPVDQPPIQFVNAKGTPMP
jgi:hypothetical protein